MQFRAFQQTPAAPPPKTPQQLYTEITAELWRREFRLFTAEAWPLIEPKPFIPNWHIDAICDHLTYVLMGEIRFLMINMPPRMTKSMLASVLFHAWVWTDQPSLQFLSASYAKDLAIRDALASRRLMESDWYRTRWGDKFYLLEDENQKKKYRNSAGGYRISTSTGATTTGEGGDILLYDDPHNMKDRLSDKMRNNALSWHDNAFRSRTNNPNTSRRIYIGQRSHHADVFGHVLQQEDKRWVVLSLPMEFEPSKRCVTHLNKGRGPGRKIYEDPRRAKGELLNPARFDRETAEAEKIAMSSADWDAQMQQDPLASGGIILKRQSWKQWQWPEDHPKYGKGDRDLPDFIEIIQTYDTALEDEEINDYSARITWGLFWDVPLIKDAKTGRTTRGPKRIGAIMLERMKERLTYPALRENAIQANIRWRPSLIPIEKKASGHSLIQELRKKGLPVRGVPIPPGLDKVSRAHEASLALEKGHVYYVPRNWAFDVIDECAQFPQGEHDDQVDAVVMGLMYMRKYMGLSFEDDDKDLKLFGNNKPRVGYR